MVQQQAGNSIRSQGDGFADDDPLAELARIVGFDQPLKREPVMTLPPAPDMSSAEFNLEDELMREFEGYEQPAVVVPDMRAPEPVVPRAPAVEASAQFAVREEPSFAPAAPAYGLEMPSYAPPPPAYEPAAPSFAPQISALEVEQYESSFVATSEPEPAPAYEPAISYDLADELEFAVADADIRPTPSVQSEPPRLRLPLANFSAQVQPVRRAEPELAPRVEASNPASDVPSIAAPVVVEAPVAAAVPQHQVAPVTVDSQEPVFEWATGAFSFGQPKGEVSQIVVPELDDLPADLGRADDYSFAAPKAEVAPQTDARQEPDFAFDFSTDFTSDDELDVALEPIKPAPAQPSSASVVDDDFDPFGDTDFDLKLDELDLALDPSDIEPVAPAAVTRPAAINPSAQLYPTATVASVAAPVIHTGRDAQPTPAQPFVPVAAERRVEPEIRFAAETRAYAPQVVSEAVAPARAQPVAAQPYTAPASARVDSAYSVDDWFGFDPSEISEQDDQVESVSALDVPEVPVTESRSAAPVQSDYDIDIDAELATLFEEPVAPPQAPVRAMGSSRVAEPAPARAPAVATPLDDFDAFEKALEEDLRSSLTSARAVDPESRGHITIAGEAQGFRFRRIKPYLMAGTAVILLLAGAGGLYAWLSNGSVGSLSGGEPQIIAADKEPVKIVPENPGGKSVPNQDKAVYDRVAGNGVDDPKQSSLISSEEEPVDVVQRTLIPETMPLEGENDRTATPVGETEDPRLLPDGQPQEAAAAEDPATITPRKVRTMIVRPDGTLVAQEVSAEAAPATTTNNAPAATKTATSPAVLAAPSVPTANAGDAIKTVATRVVNPDAPAETASANPAPTAAAATAAEPAPQSVAEIAAASSVDDNSAPAVNAPIPTMRPAEQPVNVVGTVTDQGNLRPAAPASAPAAAPTETAAATPAAAPAAAPAGSYGIQIASLPSEAEAQRSYRSLSSKFGGVLGGKPYEIRQADIPGKGTYYRVRIVAGSKDAAVALCEQYRSAGGTCLVSR